MRLQWAQIEKEFGPKIADGFKENFFNAGSAKAKEFAEMMGGSQSDLAQQMAAANSPEEKQALLNEFRKRLMASSERISTSAVGMGSVIDETKRAAMRSKASLEQNSNVFLDAQKTQELARNTTDQNTKNVVEANAAMNDMAVDMDKIVKDRVLPVAAQSIKTFTSTLNEAIDTMTEALGLNGPGKAKNVQTSSAAEDLAWGGANVGGFGGGGTPPSSGGTPPTPTAGGTTQNVLDTIKQKESGGNYQAQAKGSSASGAYQFTDSTWQSLTKKYGIGQEFAKAKDAPAQIQDLIAQKHAENFLKQAGGDVAGVAKGWYTGNVQGKMSAQALAANRGMTGDMYAADFVNRYNKNVSASGMPVGRPGSPSYNLAQGQEITAANGGTFSGPKSGYAATLHGDEAVVPLPNGRSIPVDASGGSGGGDQQLQLMLAQSSKLEQLLRIMSKTASTSDKLLKASV